MSRYTLDHGLSLLIALSLFVIAVASGCTRGGVDSAEVTTQRAAFILTEEPAGLIGVEEAKGMAVEPKEMAILGRISAGEDAPWSKGKAAFILSEVSAAAVDDLFFDDEDDAADDQTATADAATHGGEDHDPSTCPFCKKAGEQAARAIVRFHDENGQIVKIDARQLFEVEKDQLVVVQGRGEVDAAGNLIIAACGIYVRR